MLGISAVLLMASQAKTPIIHYVSLTGIEKGSYPNGVAFSPRDIQALGARGARKKFDLKMTKTLFMQLASPTARQPQRAY